MSGLFRKEAVAHQRESLTGEIVLSTNVSFTIISIILVVASIFAFTYLFWGEYHRKEVVSGYLRPTSGLARVYADENGVIDELFVQEGDAVKKGQRLARVRINRYLSSGEDINDSYSNELAMQKELIGRSIDNRNQLFETKLLRLKEKVELTTALNNQAKIRKELLSKRLELSESQIGHMTSLTDKGFASEAELDLRKDFVLELRQQVEENQSEILRTQEHIYQLKHEIEVLPFEHEKMISDLQARISNINREIYRVKFQKNYEIVSTKDGVITNLLVASGMRVQQELPLMTIVPTDTLLEAILFVPTRAFGFVKNGQRTHIRYEAFPYQRFGVYEGEIVNISKAVILPNEALLPIKFDKPVYQVVVKLKQQSATAYGVSVPLQAGMLLESDILIDKRSLFEWLFEPIYGFGKTF